MLNGLSIGCHLKSSSSKRNLSVSSELKIIFVNDLERKVKSLTVTVLIKCVDCVNNYDSEIKGVIQLKQLISKIGEGRAQLWDGKSV